MLRAAKVAVVVPAYNEARLIARTLESIPAFVDCVIVVDDGSHDHTAAIAREFQRAGVVVERHAQNLGVGAAIATGYASAIRHGADLIAVMAGDAQMDPSDLERLLMPLLDDHADYAKGDRLSHPRVFRHMPLARFIGNHGLSLFTRWVTGLSVRDSQCGYTAISRRAIQQLRLESLWPRYGYPNDLLGLLAAQGARVVDVVVRPIYADERSGIGLRHALFVVPYVLLRVLCRRVLPRRALAFVTARR